MPEPIATWNPARGVWERPETNILCGHSGLFSETWPTSGMTQGGALYPLPTPGHLTGASGFSSSPDLLPTPRTADGMHSTMAANRERMARNRSDGVRAWRGTIEEAVSLLPTPNATDSKGAGQPPGRVRDGHLRPASDADLPTAVQLLKTPTAQLAVNGGSQHPYKRRAGGHGPTLADQVECELLPTPRATDGTKGGPNQRGSSGDLMLPSAVMGLLPTPRASDTGTPGRRASEGFRPPLSQVLLPTPMAADGERQSLKMPRGNPTLTGALMRLPSLDGNLPPVAPLPGQLSLDEQESA